MCETTTVVQLTILILLFNVFDIDKKWVGLVKWEIAIKGDRFIT